MPSEDIKFQILTEHYKTSFEILQNKIRQREKLFFGVLCILVIMLFEIYTPQEAPEVISQFISHRLNIDTQIDFLFIESLVWFSLLATTLKYFQSVVYIERQYSYIHKLEGHISKEYKNQAFTREGLSYFEDYPIFLNWASFLYTIFCPIVLVFVTVSKITRELEATGSDSVLSWFNGIIFVFILVSTILYLKVIHCRK